MLTLCCSGECDPASRSISLSWGHGDIVLYTYWVQYR
ncbi:unnamed protein product [Staurois parvus]|uniref:Uncharacterized protein n=1 Tax=Staurois parvus TaxID=386267 RepID=A0ABN9G8P9_9NEOB|nr:unnamed protein product [Staurois parvus]